MNILLVEDDEATKFAMKKILSPLGRLSVASTKQDALDILDKEKFDIAFVDLDLDVELAGIDIVKKASGNLVYVVVSSGRSEDEYIKTCYGVGCKDYLTKPFYVESLDLILKKYNAIKHLSNHQDFFAKKFITADKGLIDKLQNLIDVIASDRPVLLEGATGTGKTLLAKLMHELAGLPLEKFIHLNCSEIPENLLEAELFGHEKGAFTGADKKKIGMLELADGGTLFLDEIATMPISIQKKLLRVIEDKSFYPLGSVQVKTSNFRLISATCEKLLEQVQTGNFREDLYYRIEGFNIEIPPLKERPSDILLLIKQFQLGSPRRVILSKEAIDKLLEYQWPGNTRELKKIIEILNVKSKGMIEVDDLPSNIRDGRLLAVDRSNSLLHPVLISQIESEGLSNALEKIENEVVAYFYRKNGGKTRQTIAELKISNAMFYRILERLKKESTF